MAALAIDILAHVFVRLRQVRDELGIEPLESDNPDALLSDLIDSMGFVELLAVLAQEWGVRPEAIERAAGQRFTTVASLANALAACGTAGSSADRSRMEPATPQAAMTTCWLSAVQAYLPRTIEDAGELDQRLHCPPGWLQAHAGIRRRHVWAGENALDAAAETGRASLASAGLLPEEVGALLVTSQAPPVLAGLAAALHQRLGLTPRAVALEVGGACTGFLQALWLARNLIERVETILIVALEAPSLHLIVEPGEAGEAAALFGDGVACCLASLARLDAASLPLLDVALGVEAGDDLLRVEGSGREGVRVKMDGPRLASRAIECLAGQVRQTLERHRLSLEELEGVLIHAGNGRLPALLARRLGLPEDRVWSMTAESGNLGSASLPLAWSVRQRIEGPVIWTAIGAGLTFASALTGPIKGNGK